MGIETSNTVEKDSGSFVDVEFLSPVTATGAEETLVWDELSENLKPHLPQNWPIRSVPQLGQ